MEESRPHSYERAKEMIAEQGFIVSEEQWAKIVAKFDPNNTGSFTEDFYYMLNDQSWIMDRVDRERGEVERVAKAASYVEHIAEKHAGETGKDTEHNIHVNVGDKHIVNTRLHATLTLGKAAHEKFAEISKGLFESNHQGIMIDIPCEHPEKLKEKADPLFRMLERLFFVEAKTGNELKFDCKVDGKSLKAWTVGLPNQLKGWLPIGERIVAAVFGDASGTIDLNATTKASAKTIHHNDMTNYNRRALFDHFLEGLTAKANIKLPGKIKPILSHLLSKAPRELKALEALLNLSSTIELDLDDLTKLRSLEESRFTYARFIKEFRLGREIERSPTLIRDALSALIDQGHSELHANVFIKGVVLTICFNTEALSLIHDDVLFAHYIDDDYGNKREIQERQQRTDEEVERIWTKEPRGEYVVYVSRNPNANSEEKANYEEEGERLLRA